MGTEALATRDFDLRYDTRQHVSFVASMRRMEASLISVFRKANKTFRVRRDQLQTAVNDEGFEINVIRHVAMTGDPHSLATRGICGRSRIVLEVFARADKALMRTVHPLDFIRVKSTLAESVDRDPQTVQGPTAGPGGAVAVG